MKPQVYLLRIREGDRVVAEAPMIVHDAEAAERIIATELHVIALVRELGPQGAAAVLTAVGNKHFSLAKGTTMYTGLEITVRSNA